MLVVFSGFHAPQAHKHITVTHQENEGLNFPKTIDSFPQ